MVDQSRFLEQLVSSVGNEGLEELVLRLVYPDYPHAHRTFRGPDGGIDVLSDHELPPQRAWQAKNVGEVPWAACARSLERAMQDEHPPSHYTFVFPRRLKHTDRERWRKKFRLEQLKLYRGKLTTLDYWDNLPERIESRPELINQLSGGALDPHVRKVLELFAATGVNPLASAGALITDMEGLAARAIETGRLDPYFAYGNAAREASVHDQDLPQGKPLVAIQHRTVPRYSMTVREGSAVTELSAEPKPHAVIKKPRPWFGSDADGQAARQAVRTALAKGRPIDLMLGPSVGLEVGTVPDRFDARADSDGVVRHGHLQLELSDPLELSTVLTLGGDQQRYSTALYRVPELPGSSISYAGAVGAVVLAVDLIPAGEVAGKKRHQIELDISLHAHEELPGEVLRGLRFIRELAAAEIVQFEAPGVLQPGGFVADKQQLPPQQHQEEERVAATVAAALDGLNRRDGASRRMCGDISAKDLIVATVVLDLLAGRELQGTATGEFELLLPTDVEPDADPEDFLRSVAPMHDLCGQATMNVEQIVENATALHFVTDEHGVFGLRCRAAEGGALVTQRLTS